MIEQATVFMLASNSAAARLWAEARGLRWARGAFRRDGDARRYVVLDTADRIRGLRQPKVFVISGARQRRDFPEFEAALLSTSARQVFYP